MKGDTEEDPYRIHIGVHPHDEGLVATLDDRTPAGSVAGGFRTLGALEASTPNAQKADARFPAPDVQVDMGRVLFASPEVRARVAAHVLAEHYVRLVLDLEPGLSSAMWETALPPLDIAPDTGEPFAADDPWLLVPPEPLGLWPNVAVVRRSTEFNGETKNRTEPVFREDEFDPLSYVIDARRVSRPALDVRLPGHDSDDLPSPFAFHVADSAGGDVLAASWLKTARVLHYVGHATAQGLKLARATATWAAVSESALKNSLLRLVVLEACATAGANPSNDKISFAWQLAQQVPAVVAMLSEIWSDSADLFTEVFYRELREGSPIDFAVAKARSMLYERRAELGHENDWMLPVLFLGTPGSAAVPRRAPIDETSVSTAALPLVEPETPSSPAMRRIRSGKAFRDIPLEAQHPDGEVVISADGIVSAALVADGILIGFGSESARVDAAVAERLPHGLDSLDLLCVQAAFLPSLEIAVSDAGTGYTLTRDASGRWSAPRPIAAAGRLGIGVFLSGRFVGWDPAGEEFVGPGAPAVPALVTEALRDVHGLDVVAGATHDVLAAWGTGRNDTPAAVVVARRRGTSAWSALPDLGSQIVQVGLGRPRPGMAGRGRGSTPTVIVGTRDASSAVPVVAPFDLQ